MTKSLRHKLRVVVFLALVEKGRYVQGKLILGYDPNAAALKVDNERRFRVGFKPDMANQMFQQKVNPQGHLVCLINDKDEVIGVDRLKFELIVDRACWEKSQHLVDPHTQLFLMKRTDERMVRAAPILRYQDGEIIVGDPEEYPTMFNDTLFNKMVEECGKRWFFGSTAFGVVVDYHEHPRGTLRRAKVVEIRPS